MNSLELDSSVSMPPSSVQVAVDGAWEDTWAIEYQDGMPSSQSVDEYLEKGNNGIAIEIFSSQKHNRQIFLGIRYSDRLLTATPKDFLIVSFRTIWQSKSDPTFSSMVSNLSTELTGDPDDLCRDDPTSIELGVVNSWNSLGSLEIWNSSESKNLSRKSLNQRLAEKPHLLRNKNNYVGMELNYRVNPHHWLGIQVADKQEDSWVLNKGRLEGSLKELVGVSTTN